MPWLELGKEYADTFSERGVKPVYSDEIDWDDPVAQGLIHLWAFLPGKGLIDLVAGLNLSYNSTLDFLPNGNLLSDSLTNADFTNKSINAPYTLGVRMRSTSTSGSQILYPNTGSTYGMFFLESASSVYHRPVGGSAIQWTGQNRSTLLTESWAVSRYTETDAELFKNGISQGSQNAGDWSGKSLLLTKLIDPNWPVLSNIELMPVWGRAVSAAELEEWNKNPYRILKSKSSPSVFFSAATGGVTVSPPTGTLNITGLPPTVQAEADINVEVPAGSLLITGFNPAVQTGNDITVVPPAGALALVGLAPVISISNSVDIDVPTGSLSITGYAPTVDLSDQTVVNIPVGSLKLDGVAPDLAFGPALITVPTASLELKGQIPSVVAQGAVWTKQPDSTTIWTNQLDASTVWTKQ